jgi:cell division protein FtsB
MQIKSLYDKYKPLVLDFVQRLGDVRFAGQVLFVVIVLLISWSGIKTIQTNYGLQKEISGLKQQTDLQRLENANLALQNQYFNSNQYLELAARQNFGLAKPGEKLVVVPESVAMAHTVDLPEKTKAETAEAKRPAYQRNFESWVDFFLHRQNTGR